MVFAGASHLLYVWTQGIGSLPSISFVGWMKMCSLVYLQFKVQTLLVSCGGFKSQFHSRVCLVSCSSVGVRWLLIHSSSPISVLRVVWGGWEPVWSLRKWSCSRHWLSLLVRSLCLAAILLLVTLTCHFSWKKTNSSLVFDSRQIFSHDWKGQHATIEGIEECRWLGC